MWRKKWLEKVRDEVGSRGWNAPKLAKMSDIGKATATRILEDDEANVTMRVADSVNHALGWGGQRVEDEIRSSTSVMISEDVLKLVPDAERFIRAMNELAAAKRYDLVFAMWDELARYIKETKEKFDDEGGIP